MTREEIARVLEEIATLLELKGENPFRIRAYRNGARAVRNMDEDLGEVIRSGRLTKYAGIGSHLALKIQELFQTGRLKEYEQLKKKTLPGLLDLIQIQGLGPKRVKTLSQKLKIHTVKQLKTALANGKIAKLKGFGKKMEAKLASALSKKEIYGKRMLWWEAWPIAEEILEGLIKQKGVKQAEICGSLRRKLETVGDLDFVASATDPKPAAKWFASLGSEVIAKGETKVSIKLAGGTQADLCIVSPPHFPYAETYFTGSKEHTIKLRTLSLKKGWSLSEYGFKGKGTPKAKNEEDVYSSLGLSYIPPELRENQGEIQQAAKGKLPKLIEEKDIRGTLHNHTTASDGRNTLKEMVKAAQDLGWEYIGISDHSKSSFQANGQTEERLLEQLDAIDKLNTSKQFKVHILKGCECDILASGALDFSSSVLKKLDFVIASVHSSLTQDEKTMTKRLIRALEHPETSMLGHPTGRLLLQRDPYAINITKVIDAAIANNKIIELNGHPKRLDLDWRFWKKAIEKGLKCCINCDAHSTADLEFFKMGVAIARKGWLSAKDVINTLPLKELMRTLDLLQN